MALGSPLLTSFRGCLVFSSGPNSENGPADPEGHGQDHGNSHLIHAYRLSSFSFPVKRKPSASSARPTKRLAMSSTVRPAPKARSAIPKEARAKPEVLITSIMYSSCLRVTPGRYHGAEDG